MPSLKQTTWYLRWLIAVMWLVLQPSSLSAQQQSTLRSLMEQLHREQGVNFVYDAAIDVSMPFQGKLPLPESVDEALSTLFKGTDITYQKRGKYVLLHAITTASKPEKPAKTHFTVSGYVRDEHGESLINATIYDQTTRLGTTTNSHGYDSITLNEGVHLLRFSYLGFADVTESLRLEGNLHRDVTLAEVNSLDEVVVVADLNSPVLTTQTGKISLQPHDIQTEFALLSSADVVKTLQRQSGVNAGIELASGLYVHGGNADENLFLIDGTPLYQVNHTFGLFSSFNTDVVKNVDFYKSGFPARYSGRLSSVIDVRTNDGDMHHTHASYRIGMADGSVHVEGPIRLGNERKMEQEGKVRGIDYGTSYNIGLRRSWVDLISRPIMALVNSGSQDDKFNLNYAFHDFNGKLTHIFSSRSRLFLSLYSGRDAFSTKEESSWQYGSESTLYQELYKAKLKWGNYNAALNWNYQFSPKLFANFTAVYSRNKSAFVVDETDQSDINSSTDHYYFHAYNNYQSTISDVGYRTEFDYRPAPQHHLRFGHDFTFHSFQPQTYDQYSTFVDTNNSDTITHYSSNRHKASELTLYAEDEMSFGNRWNMNLGFSANGFLIQGKTFFSVDPRLALKYQVARNVSLKSSYTFMTQYVHKISNVFLDLPTDYWVPTTKRLHPMHSQQFALGAYWNPSARWLLKLEDYYKQTKLLLLYSSVNGLEPPANAWDEMVMDGQGRYYGVELDAAYKSQTLELSANYTLSWNKRYYEQFYKEWFYDKFDNRHKLCINARFHLRKNIEAYAAWTIHSGNRMSLPTQYVKLPDLPEGAGQKPYYEYTDYEGDFMAYDVSLSDYIYERPNNITLPVYHRLDLGFNFNHTTKKGHLRTWNVSLYNAYCHLNSLWVDLDVDLDGRFVAKNRGYIPVIPSVSYMIKF